MAHLSVSQIFLIFVSKPAVSLQPVFTLFPLLSPSHQHLAGLQPAIILALSEKFLHRKLNKAQGENSLKYGQIEDAMYSSGNKA